MDDAVTSTAIPIADFAERQSQGDIHGQVMPGTEPSRQAQPMDTIWLPPVPMPRARGERRVGRGALVLAGFASTLIGVGLGVRVLDDGEPRPRADGSVIATRVGPAPQPPGPRASASTPAPAPRPKSPPSAAQPTNPPPAKATAEAEPAPTPTRPRSPQPSGVPRKPPSRDIAAADQCLTPFDSKPDGVEIVVNGVVRGVTPAKLPLPCGTPVTVTLKKARYVSATRTVTPSLDAKAKGVFAIIRHQTVWMKVSSTPRNVAVTYRDFPWRRPRYTPGDMDIYVDKEITLRFALAGYEAVERAIVPVEGGTIHVDLKRLSP